ncbi:uncharacterized protein LAJ45_08915 [Morchella importuna]|uniref:4Fe-4S ferredoxin-type domain-containing protein n=1 Tax=Morchella conica CCBAS932 TaxID=1392247 RepID=A0A3N4KHB4_9PEZI|nr:uncharacterized protein LAJ45_08915 [Morchella importuna]KAH8147115.1 hypothetical protein LAJ45_08915 [Morchella importuna]RPB09936.1 hypothetical protein P167DRAFT_566938 [Morchella conica CCBAS932]
MKFQTLVLVALSALVSTVFAIPTPDCNVCANSCTVQCAAQAPRSCFCPQVCDPEYSTCTTRRSLLGEREATPAPAPAPATNPCGCYNDCTFYGCGDDVAPEDCICTKECDLKYACDATPTETIEARQVTCGPCTNACKINCPTCICPEYCDPAYECPATE